MPHVSAMVMPPQLGHINVMVTPPRLYHRGYAWLHRIHGVTTTPSLTWCNHGYDTTVMPHQHQCCGYAWLHRGYGVTSITVMA